MGWSQVAARSHARRLEDQGWLARYPMTRGEGSLFVATRTGVQMLGVSLRSAGHPAPTWWAHHCACAWVAAYLQVRERAFLGDRELLQRPRWSGRIAWIDGKGLHELHHRPDLVGFLETGEAVAMEVELTQKSAARLRAIIERHAEWTRAGQTAGVIYICGDPDVMRRVQRVARNTLGTKMKGLAIRALDSVRETAIETGEARRADQASSRSAVG